MKRSFIRAIFLFGLVAGGLKAREMRTPLPFMQGLMNPRYPVEYHWDIEKDKNENCWGLNFCAFGAGYFRSANDAYSRCHGTDRIPFPCLLFGKTEFRMEEAFMDADVASEDLGTNPFIAISTLTPRFIYEESGAVLGAQVGVDFEWCGKDYRAGLRARLPFRDIRVEDVCGHNMIGESLDDVFREREETTSDPKETNVVYIARLDFLTSLNRVAFPLEGMVDYGTAPNSMRIADQLVTGDAAITNQPIVGVIYSTDKSMPIGEVWGKQHNVTDPIVDAAGGGLSDKERGRFGPLPIYTPLKDDTDAQGKLFVVPTLNDSNAGGVSPNKLTGGASIIRAAINNAINNLNDSVQDFIKEKGLDFCDGRVKGVGDLDIEFYLGCNFGCEDSSWVDAILGVRLPTADELDDCKKIIMQPLGNNDHVEGRIGVAGGWDALDWVKFMGDASVSHVFSATESIAAPFKGATVKNIGPCLCADINWNYLTAHADVTFLAADCCGFDVGYEIYCKDCDNICINQTKATDLLGRENQILDPCLLAEDTKRISHKVRVGFYSMIEDCEIFGGWSHVFAGKNIPRETDWYMSFMVHF